MKLAYTAGEAIGPEIFTFFRSLGINIKQLYGQTEATVFVCIQPDGEVMADTVGKAAPGVELKIAEDGEVFYRSAGFSRNTLKIRKRPQKQNRRRVGGDWRRRDSPGKRTLDDH